MQLIKKLFLFFLVFVHYNNVLAQDKDRKTFAPIPCTYIRPISIDGLNSTTLLVTPKIRIERWEKSSQIILDISEIHGTALNPNPAFEYKYNYKGKLYGNQHIGKEPFEELKQWNFRYEVRLVYKATTEWTKIVDGKTNIFGPIEKDANASDVVVWIKVVSVMTDNSEAVENKIRKLLNSEKESITSTTGKNNSTQEKQQTSISDKPTSTSAKTTAQSNNSTSQSKSKANTTNESSNSQIQNADKPNLVQTTNGKYYQKGPDGQFKEISQQSYQNLKTEQQKNISNQNKTNQEWSQQQVNDYLDKDAASRKAKQDAITKQSASFQQKLDASVQSYYAGQAIANAREGFKNNSTLDGKYNSVSELEADFNTKYQAISYNAQEYQQGQNNQLQAGYNYYFNDADAKGKAIGQLAVGIGSLINQADAERKERLAREQLQQERKIMLEKMEAERKANQLVLRNNFISKFVDGGLPLSSHKVFVDEIYLFAYVLDKNTLTQEIPIASISNVFPLSKYSDETWPYKSNIIKEISKNAGSNSITLMGYYTSKETAEQMRNSFINIAAKCEMKVNSFIYKGKIADLKSESKTDYWGNQKENTNDTNNNNSKESSATEDYWGNPIKKTNTTKQVNPISEEKKTTKKEVKLDYWGNPIKE